nr:hypothetical protein CFP56_68724 [Quercus suber]
MHSEGTESSGEAGHSKNRRIMVAIEDLQHSQVAMWAEFQSQWLLEYSRRFRDLSLLCYDLVEKERLVDVYITGMLYEYRFYLENLQISSFTRLVEAARRKSMSVRKPLKGSTSQAMSTPKWSWRRENKKVEVAVAEESKKGVKGHEDPMKEEAENIASSNLAPPPLVDEEMVMRIQQEDKIHAFLEGIGLKLMARRKATQALTRVMERNHEVVWRKKQVVIEATKMSFDTAELHFAEATLYQEYEPEGENRILTFNPIALQLEEEDHR